MIIYLVLLLPAASSDPPESSPGRFKRFPFGLASDGVYMCPARYRAGGSLLHCLSTITAPNGTAVYLCCTGLGVTSTGRYPASCPVKPGLSSPECITYNHTMHIYTLYTYILYAVHCTTYAIHISRDHLSYSHFCNDPAAAELLHI